ncbi:cupin domain-containing protein, partial [Chloroflexota bacterium]
MQQSKGKQGTGMQRSVGEELRGWICEQWMVEEGIPIYKAAAGIEDIAELPRQPWARMGGKGTFIQLGGTKEAGKLMWVAEIPGGGALEPERHLYDELLYIMQGRGIAEVWHEGQGKVSFEFGESSMFAIPLNAWHRLVNGGREPVLVFAQSDAPVVMQSLRNTEFIFNCDYNFTDRFGGKSEYFDSAKENMYTDPGRGGMGGTYWVTNFVPSLLTAPVQKRAQGGGGAGGISFQMASWSGASVSEDQAGTYNMAHCHRGGAVLMGV